MKLCDKEIMWGIRYTKGDENGTFACLCTDGNWHDMADIKRYGSILEGYVLREAAEEAIDYYSCRMALPVSDYDIVIIRGDFLARRMESDIIGLLDV